MNDRELLELAAKAAGIGAMVWGDVWNVGGDLIDCTDMPYIRSGQPDEGDVYWNPLDDDGDALRLAVKLKLKVDTDYSFYPRSCTRVTNRWAPSIMEEHEDGRGTGGDAATRRAIVRAAAEIGKNV